MAELISIVEADPDLGELLDEPSRERARREALTRVRHLSPGAWDASTAIEPGLHHRGFLIIDDRLLLTLWHPAERWGRVRADGMPR